MMVETFSEPIPFDLYGDVTTLQPTVHQDANDPAFPLDIVTISPAAQSLHAEQELLAQQNVPSEQAQALQSETTALSSPDEAGSTEVASSVGSAASLWNAALQMVSN